MAHKLGWLAALVIVAMLGVVGDSWTLQEAASLGDRSVALASQATPTSTPERFAPSDIRGPLQQPTATSTPMPEREIVMPDETIRLATPTATRQPEPPEICRTRRGAIVPCDDMGPGNKGDDDVG